METPQQRRPTDGFRASISRLAFSVRRSRGDGVDGNGRTATVPSASPAVHYLFWSVMTVSTVHEGRHAYRWHRLPHSAASELPTVPCISAMVVTISPVRQDADRSTVVVSSFAAKLHRADSWVGREECLSVEIHLLLPCH